MDHFNFVCALFITIIYYTGICIRLKRPYQMNPVHINTFSYVFNYYCLILNLFVRLNTTKV